MLDQYAVSAIIASVFITACALAETDSAASDQQDSFAYLMESPDALFLDYVDGIEARWYLREDIIVFGDVAERISYCNAGFEILTCIQHPIPIIIPRQPFRQIQVETADGLYSAYSTTGDRSIKDVCDAPIFRVVVKRATDTELYEYLFGRNRGLIRIAILDVDAMGFSTLKVSYVLSEGSIPIYQDECRDSEMLKN